MTPDYSPGAVHAADVQHEIEQLRGATEQDLDRFKRERIDKRIRWYQLHGVDLPFDKAGLLMAAYQLVLYKLEIQPEQAPIVERTEDWIVLHSMNFCPTLIACQRLGLDTRHICRAVTEAPMDALLKELDPRLQFARNYDRLRPYSEYCEEMISIREDR